MEDEAGAAPEKRRLPAWLLGLVIAAVIFVLVLLVLQALGFGDDPVLDGAIGLQVV